MHRLQWRHKSYEECFGCHGKYILLYLILVLNGFVSFLCLLYIRKVLTTQNKPEINYRHILTCNQMVQI